MIRNWKKRNSFELKYVKPLTDEEKERKREKEEKEGILSARSTKRLMKDMREVYQAELDTISIHVQDHNIFEWHVNLVASEGPCEGMVLHMIMRFPLEYPHKPPQITTATRIIHSNVSKSLICLDMLEASSSTTPYEGWSTAYSALSILLQLQSFLFTENVPQDYGGTVNTRGWSSRGKPYVHRALNRYCPCGHTGRTPNPPVEKYYSNLPLHMICRARGKVTGQNKCSFTANPGGNNQSVMACVIGNRGVKMTVDPSIDPPPPHVAGVVYEAEIVNKTDAQGMLCVQFGWCTSNGCRIMGKYCFMYCQDGTFSIDRDNGIMMGYAEPFGPDDTISCALDFKKKTARFAKNGNVVGKPYNIPKQMKRKHLFPFAYAKNCEIDFNFDAPKIPVKKFRKFVSVNVCLNPPKPDIEDDDVKISPKKEDTRYQDMTEEVLVHCFSFLNIVELHRVSRTCEHWCDVEEKWNLVERPQVICFHTHKSYVDDILGVDISVKYYPESHDIKEISSELDLLSKTAFETEEVRRGVWRGKFEHFMPLIINKWHGHKSMEIIQNVFAKICHQEHFVPLNFLDVVCDLMNSFVVSLFPNYKEPKVAARYSSEKALLGYCSFHHLLLFFAKTYPEIVEEANARVRAFLEGEDNRIKKVMPDIGGLLILLTITDRDLGWEAVSKVFVSEVFDRQALWLLRGFPHLQEVESSEVKSSEVNPQRIKETFNATKTPNRHVMFQVYFLRNVGRPEMETPETILEAYNRSLGRPTPRMKEALQRACKSILTMESWGPYFQCVGLESPDDAKMTAWLRQSILNSEKKGYHRRPRKERNF